MPERIAKGEVWQLGGHMYVSNKRPFANQVSLSFFYLNSTNLATN